MSTREPKYSSLSPSKGPHHGHAHESSFLLWRWELAGITLSVAATIAIITILWYMDGKALAEWSVGIGLNTTIQAFTTIAQTAMMVAVTEGISQLKWTFFQKREQRLADLQTFDEASRGPWGAFLLLLKIRWHAILASSAALITLLALLMGTFTQQAVGLPTHSVQLHNETATLQIARDLDTNQPLLLTELPSNSEQGEFSNIYPELSAPTVYDVGLNDAIYSGLFAPSLLANHACSSGNCTWDFETLGICGSCSDVSNDTIIDCTSGLVDPTAPGSATLPRSQICSYKTPPGFQADAWACINANSSTLMNSSLSTASYPWNPLFSMAFFHFAQQAAVPAFNGLGTNASHCQLPKPTVYECEFTWCVKSYASTVTGDTFNDVPVKTEPLVFNSENGTVYNPDRNISCSPKGPSGEVGIGWSGCINEPGINLDSSTWLSPAFKAQDYPFPWPSPGPFPDADNENAYWINVADAYDLVDNLQNVLNASLDTQLKSSADKFLSARLWKLISTNASATFEDMATSLTNAIRDGPNATTVVGNAYRNETYVHVKWPWLILPIGLVVATAAFLAACMIISRPETAVVWKSSLLPILFHGLRGWSNSEMNNARTLKDMEKAADEMYALLEERDDGEVQLWKKIAA